MLRAGSAGVKAAGSESPLGEAEKYARLFLRHLPEFRGRVESRYAELQALSPRDNSLSETLNAVLLADGAIRRLLALYGGANGRAYDWTDLAGWIAGWGLPLIGRRKANLKTDPLCIFVHGIFVHEVLLKLDRWALLHSWR